IVCEEGHARRAVRDALADTLGAPGQRFPGERRPIKAARQSGLGVADAAGLLKEATAKPLRVTQAIVRFGWLSVQRCRADQQRENWKAAPHYSTPAQCLGLAYAAQHSNARPCPP